MDQNLDDDQKVDDVFPKNDNRRGSSGGKTRMRTQRRTKTLKKILPYKMEKVDRDVDQKSEREISMEDVNDSTVPIFGSLAKYESLGTINVDQKSEKEIRMEDVNDSTVPIYGSL